MIDRKVRQDVRLDPSDIEAARLLVATLPEGGTLSDVYRIAIKRGLLSMATERDTVKRAPLAKAGKRGAR